MFKIQLFAAVLSQLRLSVNQGAYIVAAKHFCKVSLLVHVENIDWHFILFAEGCGSYVHHFKIAGDHLFIGDVVELGGSGVLLRVCGIDAVNSCAFEHDVGLYFNSA